MGDLKTAEASKMTVIAVWWNKADDYHSCRCRTSVTKFKSLRPSLPSPSAVPSLEESHGVQRSSDTTGRTSSLLTPNHFFLLCIRNPAPQETYYGLKQKYSFINRYFFVPLSKILSFIIPRLKDPPLRSVCFTDLYVDQVSSYSIPTVEISFLHPHKHLSLTLKTNLLSWALSCFRMRLFKSVFSIQVWSFIPPSPPRNLCLAAPLQTVECQEGRGDRFDSNRTMKRT